MRGVATVWLIAGVLALAGCGQPGGEPPAAAESESALEEISLEEGANVLFAAMCGGLNMDAALCGCVRDRVAAETGVAGLLYIAAAFGVDPTLAAPLEAQMSQDERNDAAEAFLNGQFDCVMAADPDYAAPTPDAQPAGAESPFEQAVAACFESGAAEEPECRCRVERAFDALGEDGLALALADAHGDTAAMADLAQRHGGTWLDQGQDVLEAAAGACR